MTLQTAPGRGHIEDTDRCRAGWSSAITDGGPRGSVLSSTPRGSVLRSSTLPSSPAALGRRAGRCARSCAAAQELSAGGGGGGGEVEGAVHPLRSGSSSAGSSADLEAAASSSEDCGGGCDGDGSCDGVDPTATAWHVLADVRRAQQRDSPNQYGPWKGSERTEKASERPAKGGPRRRRPAGPRWPRRTPAGPRPP